MLIELLIFLFSLISFTILIPNILNVLRTGNLEGITFGMLMTFIVMSTLFLMYSVLENSLSIFIVNVISLLLSVNFLYYKNKSVQ